MRLKKIISISIIAILLSNTINVLAASNNNQYDSSLQNYEFSANLDTDEWKDFSDHYQKMKSCEIDKQVLDKIPTEKLVDLLLDYPLLIDAFSYDSFQKGIEVLSTYCDPIIELETRDDAGTYLLDNYKQQEVKNVFAENDYTTSNNNNYIKMSILEILLAQSNISSKLSIPEKNELSEEIEKKNQEKSADIRFGISKTIYSQVKLDNNTYYQLKPNNAEKLSLCSYFNITPILAATTITYGVSILPVYTPNGTAIYPLMATNDYTSDEKTAINNQYINSYPNASYLSTSTAKYNCHSYAWHSQSTSNILWINSPSAYWSDGSYSYVGTSPTANSQKVYYDRSGTEHSGVVTDYSTKLITSKWGQGPLMQHNVYDCPYYVIPWAVLPTIKYYKR